MPPVVLGYPREGMQFVEGDVVVLQWKPALDLPDDAYYVPTVLFTRQGETWIDDTPWLRDVTWTLSEHAYLPQVSDDGVFRWSVQLMRKTGVDPVTGRAEGVPLSAPSQEWTFRWTRK